MKNVIVIVVASIVSMLLIVQLFFLLYATKPEYFGLQNPQVNSTNMGVQLFHKDSLAIAEKKISEDTTVLAHKNAGIKQAKKKEKNEPPHIQPIAAAITPVDSVDWKDEAKILEAMKIEDASKILRTMNDKDVRSIIGKLKKKTAAKILASFEPERAARLLR